MMMLRSIYSESLNDYDSLHDYRRRAISSMGCNDLLRIEGFKMNDLEYYARYMHEWPGNDTTNVIRALSRSPNSPGVTKAQWLAERARLQNKPKEWPKWAKYLCQDSYGYWAFHSHKPEHGDRSGYWHSSYKEKGACSGEVLGDWRDTLEKRPEQITTPTHTNHRCVQVNIDDTERKEWKQGELPPVGTVCEVRETITQFSVFAKWSECTILAINTGRQKDKQFIIKDKNGDAAILYEVDGIEFRPQRTEEEKAVEEMCNIIRDAHIKYLGASPSTDYEIRCAAIALHNEGYRKLDNPDASN